MHKKKNEAHISFRVKIKCSQTMDEWSTWAESELAILHTATTSRCMKDIIVPSERRGLGRFKSLACQEQSHSPCSVKQTHGLKTKAHPPFVKFRKWRDQVTLWGWEDGGINFHPEDGRHAVCGGTHIRHAFKQALLVLISPFFWLFRWFKERDLWWFLSCFEGGGSLLRGRRFRRWMRHWRANFTSLTPKESWLVPCSSRVPQKQRSARSTNQQVNHGEDDLLYCLSLSGAITLLSAPPPIYR